MVFADERGAIDTTGSVGEEGGPCLGVEGSAFGILHGNKEDIVSGIKVGKGCVVAAVVVAVVAVCGIPAKTSNALAILIKIGETSLHGRDCLFAESV